MPEGHTLFALARDLDAAFGGTQPTATSPQGRFAAGAALLDGRTFLHATSWGKHLFVEFEGDAWLHVHLGLIGTFRIDEHGYAGDPPVVGQVRLRLVTEEHVADLRGPNLCAVITPEQVEAVTSRLGPDPLRPEPDPELAWRKIARTSKTIAELLMDLAGPRRPAPPGRGDREDRHRRGAGRGGARPARGGPGRPAHRTQLLRLQATGRAVPGLRVEDPDPGRRRTEPVLVRQVPAPPLTGGAWVSRARRTRRWRTRSARV